MHQRFPHEYVRFYDPPSVIVVCRGTLLLVREGDLFFTLEQFALMFYTANSNAVVIEEKKKHIGTDCISDHLGLREARG